MGLQSTMDDLLARVGQEVHVSGWITVDQARIDAFAEATGDHQWIHTDPDRAAADSPYGGTIAHGYLTLSLYPMLRGMVEAERPLYPGVRQVINYGLEKLRFPNAVRSGSRIRGHTEIVAVSQARDALQVTERFTVEVEGESRPACVADAVMRFYFET